MPAPLNNDQKRYLSQLARRAHAKLGPELDGQSEQDYRRAAVAQACGKHGLRCCSQDDYGAVKAHFLDVLGESGKAMNALVNQAGNKKRIAEFKLLEACNRAGVNISYAVKICQNRFKCQPEDCTAEQLWQLVFTINNRGRKVTFPKETIAA